MTKETIIQTDNYTLQRISFKLKMKPIYREVIKQNGQLSVKEYDKPPIWFVRLKKINYLLNEE
jgi:hypothetical protein